MTEPTRPLPDEAIDQAKQATLSVGPSLEALSGGEPSLFLSLGTGAAELARARDRRLTTAPTALLDLARRVLEDLAASGHGREAILGDETRRARIRALLEQGSYLLEGEIAVELLDWWRSLCPDRLRVVIALEHPAIVARRARDRGESAAVALAGYERDHRALVRGASGLDVEILLREAEVTDDGPKVPKELNRLFRVLEGLAGRHVDFQPPKLGHRSSFGRELLELHEDLGRVLSGVSFLAGELETVLRAEIPHQAPRNSVRDNEDEVSEPNEDGRYPLDASQDRAAYHRWLAARREPAIIGGLGDAVAKRASTRAPREAPLVSILVPVYRTPLWALERCIASVLVQDDARWELCLVDDGSGSPELAAYLHALDGIDRRIKVGALEQSGGISAATNRALELSSGSFIGFLDHDDELARDAISTVAAEIESHPNADLLYSDEDKIDENGERFDPLFKPEWSPDLLLSFAYTCHLSVVRRQLLSSLGGLRSEFDGSQDYDLALRASEKAREIVHIARVLYHWRSLPTSAASGAGAKPWAYEAGRLAIEDAMKRRSEPAAVLEHPDFPGRYHVRRKPVGRPLASVIIPFRDEPALLATCAASLREAPGYDRLELVLVDNGSELPETEALLDELRASPDVRVVRSPGPFNWAAINNAAAREASGDVLVFMNNDIEAQVPGWLDALLGHAMRPEVGAVGARLVYPDGDIQHAGVVIGLGGIAGHVLRGLPSHRPGYNSMAISTRNCSVVTGACMMVRREVFEEVGGFDEELPVAFNDVDFCLKLRERGYLVVYTPLAELVHHESRSRGHTDDLAENQRIRERWGHVLDAGDPYMNVHLSHWRYWCPLSTAQEDYRWKVYLETPVPPLDSSMST